MRIVCYRGADGDWRWRMVAANGRIVADSAEGYRRRGQCVRMAHQIAAGDIQVVVEP